MRTVAVIGIILVVGVIALLARDSGPDIPDSPVTSEAPPPGEITTADPDTTGAAMWAHIQEENYAANWALWPGMSELYEGNQPHGALLTTYVNDIALDALNSGQMTMPEGAVVIKENFTPNQDLAAVTVMYKRDGYNPDHNDWFFSKYLPGGELDQAPNGMAMEGRVPGCQSCHTARQDFDYLYTPRVEGG